MPKRSRQSRRGKRATRSRRKCGGKGTRKYRYRGGFDLNSTLNELKYTKLHMIFIFIGT